mmetsp:Transcript_14368/g.27614  ORF Transcript_14368/g.27614 Transcript_14368/m.27614 type:complete len:203 (-) Transcript_14368:160-768(-)
MPQTIQPVTLIDVSTETIRRPAPIGLAAFPVALALPPLPLEKLALLVEKRSESLALVVLPLAVVLHAVLAVVVLPEGALPAASALHPPALVLVPVRVVLRAAPMFLIPVPLSFISLSFCPEHCAHLALLVSIAIPRLPRLLKREVLVVVLAFELTAHHTWSARRANFRRAVTAFYSSERNSPPLSSCYSLHGRIADETNARR